MRVNADTLVSIAQKMVKLEQIDIIVASFEVNGFTCTVETTDSQMEGRTYYLTGLVKKV